MELGQKLKEARGKAALSQTDVAQNVGVSRQTVSNWENSRSYPDIGSLIKLSQLYGLSLDEMIRDDPALPAHFENLAARRRKFWELILEIGVVAEILGWLLLGLAFPTMGMAVTAVGVVLVYAGLIMHLRHFDHTAAEVRNGILGLAIQLGCLLLTLCIPDWSNNILLSVIRLAGIWLLWSAGVWSSFRKSPRLWLIIVLYVTVPLVSLVSELQTTGSLSEDTPFSHEYRVAQVLYPEKGEDQSTVKVDLYTILTEHRLRIAENGTDYEDIGIFSYMEPLPQQTETSVWQLIPEDAPGTLYKVASEADGSVTLSCSENEQLQYKWLLTRVDTCGVGISTIGKVTSMRPNWYPAGSEDPEPYWKDTTVVRKATLSVTMGGQDTTKELTLVEEYHHGDAVEYQTYSLQPGKSGSYSMKIATRYDGELEYALYRIPYDGGEYRFTVTFGY